MCDNSVYGRDRWRAVADQSIPAHRGGDCLSLRWSDNPSQGRLEGGASGALFRATVIREKRLFEGDEAIASASTLKAFAASSRRIDPGLVFNFWIMANIVISPNSPHPFVQPGCGRVDPAQYRNVGRLAINPKVSFNPNIIVQEPCQYTRLGPVPEQGRLIQPIVSFMSHGRLI